MSIHLPQPIETYFDADRKSAELVVSCFATDARVQDEGKTYRGLGEIRQWRTNAAAKYTYTCEPLLAEEQGDRTVVTCRLAGNFPGSRVDLRFIFRLAGDKIEALEIVP
jgi:hypothetical protein